MKKTLEYIGPKVDGERHHSEHTGIVWMPGDVHDVDEHHAQELLKHPTSWREAERTASALEGANTTTSTDAGGDADSLPAWAKKGIELGATDEQLEAIAQAGGPETEAGAALWKDATGTDWKPTEAPQRKDTGKAKAAAKKTAGKAKRG